MRDHSYPTVFLMLQVLMVVVAVLGVPVFVMQEVVLHVLLLEVLPETEEKKMQFSELVKSEKRPLSITLFSWSLF